MSLSPWWLAIRPKTLPASISPILVGNVLAIGPQFDWAIAVATLLGALLLQISVNFANDYFDYKHGIDAGERLGPIRATQAGLITPKAMFRAMIVTLLAAVAIGVYLITQGGEVFIWLTIACVIGVLWYSGGPFPLASLGLGEVTVFLFFGLVAVLGTQYLQLHSLTNVGWKCAVQMGFLSAAIMLVNNIRDIDSDTEAGKRTLAVRLGKANSEKLYSLLLIVPLLIQAVLLVMSAETAGPLLPLLSLPWAIRLIKALPQCQAQAYNQQLAKTAQFLLMFALLLCIGMVFDNPIWQVQ